MKKQALHILLIDDHALFRQGMKYLLLDLHSAITFSELDSCENIPDVNAGIDMVLLDYYLPGVNGLSAIEVLTRRLPSIPVVVLSSADDPIVIQESIASGASGFIPKSSTQDSMIAALQLILAGGTYLPMHVLDQEGIEGPEAIIKPVISGRQLDVLLKAVKGKPNKIICAELKIAEGTVKAHLSSAYKILGVRNRTEAVFAVARLGLDHPDVGV